MGGTHKLKTDHPGTAERSTSKSSMHSSKSQSKRHPFATNSRSLINPNETSVTRSTSNTIDNKSDVKSSKNKVGHPSSSKHKTSGGTRIKSKSKARSSSRRARGTSYALSTSKQKNRTRRTKSNTPKKRTTSNVRSPSKSVRHKGKSVNKSRTKSSVRSAKTKGKHPRTSMKNRTETCAVQFVPKFNPNSNKNQVPIYHLIRHAFGNMVREAICQLDKNKAGVSSQQIIDHILKHYSFPNNLSESAIRNRTLFTINSGLRAGTLITASPNKGVRIGRMRRIYPRLLC
ncbi:hypothetical protein I4U23_020901 [Adineta vaga]|nr:hypothetical protein I4U23_020901 [Adineta vaga]